MRLTPHEQERLLLSYAADLALRRKERGIRLNPALRFDRDKARPA
jgi:urease subunit gamma